MTLASYLIDITGLAFSEENGGNSVWVHALPIGSYKHPMYGTIDITSDRAKNFAEGVNNKVRGIDLSINYVHNNADIAAGWVKKAESRSDGVWLFVEFTSDAAVKVKNKEWRYFSSEFQDEWEDAKGVKHKDVMFGGALTNRPFMKNLVPINLSEQTLDTAFELVSIVNGLDLDSLKGGKGMELSDEQIAKIVEGVSLKMTEKKTEDPTVTKLTEIPELKQLADENPLVALLIKTVESQNVGIKSSAQQLKLAEIERKLSDFDRSKVVLTPRARNLAATLAEAMPTELSESFWELLTEMKRGTSFLVELGERAGATVNYGSHKSALQQLNEVKSRILTERKDLTDTDAFELAVKESPALYARYRQEQMEGATN